MTHRPSDSSRPMQFLLLSGDAHQNPGSAAKYPCSVCTHNVTGRWMSYMRNCCSGWVHSKCAGLQKAVEYRRIKNWACISFSSPPTPHIPQSNNNSLIKAHLKNIQNFTTVRKDRHQGQEGGLLTLIHKSIKFSLRPESPDTLEELTLTAKLGNTELIITNVYIPPSSSCTGGYNLSLDHLITTTYSRIAPNDTDYKRWSFHSGYTLVCILCRNLPPPAMGARFSVFWGKAGHGDSLDGWRCFS